MKDNITFELGSLVQFTIAGGPFMIVVGIQPHGEVECMWWSTSRNDLQKFVFPKAILVLVEVEGLDRK